MRDHCVVCGEELKFNGEYEQKTKVFCSNHCKNIKGYISRKIIEDGDISMFYDMLYIRGVLFMNDSSGRLIDGLDGVFSSSPVIRPKIQEVYKYSVKHIEEPFDFINHCMGKPNNDGLLINSVDDIKINHFNRVLSEVILHIVIYRTLALETYDMLKKKFNIADRIRYRKELATFKKLAIEYSKEPVLKCMLQVITRLIAVFMYDGGVKSEK